MRGWGAASRRKDGQETAPRDEKPRGDRLSRPRLALEDRLQRSTISESSGWRARRDFSAASPEPATSAGCADYGSEGTAPCGLRRPASAPPLFHAELRAPLHIYLALFKCCLLHAPSNGSSRRGAACGRGAAWTRPRPAYGVC